ncbi:MAG: ATP-dependent DNA ligase [Euryarchaeota archaeon]|nr:ATP-dependent DNA ligase [Euryarchaeota archaeon]
MEYSRLVSVYESLEATSSKLEKTEIVARFLREVPEDLLDIIPSLLIGRVFPEWSELELGIGPSLLYEAVAFVCGTRASEVKGIVARAGDVGEAVEQLLARKVQLTLFARKLLVREVYEAFKKIALASGAGSQDRKVRILADLLASASPKEGKYLVRTVLGELRVGVAEGLLRDAIAQAFNVSVSAVERAYMVANDFGTVARAAKLEGEEGLARIKMEVGRPIKPMLAQLAPSIEKVFEELGSAALEIKYDGARVQIHKRGDEVKIFSRRLENVTSALPDIARRAARAIKAEEAIVEGEAVAIDPKTRRPRAFQDILRRFRRKYDVEKMMEEIPFETYLFDILYLEGEVMIDLPFEKRRQKLGEVVEEEKGKFELAEQLVTGDVKRAHEFYSRALAKGHEGMMIKNLKAPYIPGARVGYMYKVKPVMETLDLVITGALWGTGKRAGWLSSYILAARDEDTGELLEVGRVGTGVTEEQLEEFTARLKPLIEFEEAGEVRLKPSVVVEVAYQEIQRSPNYASGFALRFPRVVRIRDDKSPEEADTVQRVKELYEMQRQAR